MKVHLIRTPEYPAHEYREVLELLQSFIGPIAFLASKQTAEGATEVSKRLSFLRWFRPEFKFRDTKPETQNIFDAERNQPLSWRELFSVCSDYRVTNDIPEDDFVMVLTLRRNSLNWFASIERNDVRNVFIQCSDWEYFTKSPSKFPISYQVISYVMRSLMDWNVKSSHQEPIGCMNDFCQNKSQVVLKLRTADICGFCMKQIQERQVPVPVTQQVLASFEKIRLQMLFSQGFGRSTMPSKLTIDAGFRLSLSAYGDIEINMGPAAKSIYFLFLNHPEGIRFSEMPNHQAELLDIYREISPRASDRAIEKTVTNICGDSINAFPSLRKYVSDINKEIRTKIGSVDQELHANYLHNGQRGELYGIQLDRSLLEVHRSITVLTQAQL